MDTEFIDIGANLTHESFGGDLGAVLARAAEAGVGAMVVTGASAQESAEARDLARVHPGTLYATAGVHPHWAKDWDEDTAAKLADLAASVEVVAVGETGLDFNRDFSPRPQQEAVFAAQLAIAVELGAPVFLHERDAHERFVGVLSEYRDALSEAVIHCFTGDREQLHRYLDLGLHVGITGWICDERRGTQLREIVSAIPLARLMIETDAPYLLPRDLQPKPKSRRNEPMYLPHIAHTVAQCREESQDEIAQATTANARRFFRIDT